jgi:hypothetical protein
MKSVKVVKAVNVIQAPQQIDVSAKSKKGIVAAQYKTAQADQDMIFAIGSAWEESRLSKADYTLDLTTFTFVPRGPLMG